MGRLKPTLENLALRLAAAKGGRVRPNDLAPYLPVSLETIETHLNEMVDDSVVFETEIDEARTYEFPELLDAPKRPMRKDQCLSCDATLGQGASAHLCPTCADRIGRELMTQAETDAWPAQAVWQHEILFITASASGPIRIAEVAGRSRMPLKRVKARLAEMAAKKWARQVIDGNHGVLTYELPKIVYPRAAFELHDRFIRTHPSSLKDEFETRLIRALVSVLIVAAGCLVLAVFHFPFPMILLGGLIASAVAAGAVFLHRSHVSPEQI